MSLESHAKSSAKASFFLHLALDIIIIVLARARFLTSPLVKDKVAPRPPRSHRGEGFLRHLTYAITPRANFVA